MGRQGVKCLQKEDLISPKSVNSSARIQGLVFYNWNCIGDIGGGNIREVKALLFLIIKRKSFELTRKLR